MAFEKEFHFIVIGDGVPPNRHQRKLFRNIMEGVKKVKGLNIQANEKERNFYYKVDSLRFL